jgi:hypothetical protein
LKRPKTVKQLWSFIGAANFYQDMYPQQSHILALLTALAKGKGAVKWMHQCQTSFDTMKALLAKDAFWITTKDLISIVMQVICS